jgi:hypothetical protein
VAVRYRCTACGNLTRFDVTVTRRERAYHHYSIGGELRVDEREVLSETVEAVSCRWCGHGRAVEPIADDGPVPPDKPSGSDV